MLIISEKNLRFHGEICSILWVCWHGVSLKPACVFPFCHYYGLQQDGAWSSSSTQLLIKSFAMASETKFRFLKLELLFGVWKGARVDRRQYVTKFNNPLHKIRRLQLVFPIILFCLNLSINETSSLHFPEYSQSLSNSHSGNRISFKGATVLKIPSFPKKKQTFDPCW